MQNKKVCIIRSNPVKPDSRVEKEAWTLKKAGYDVHILAWDRDSSLQTNDTVNIGEIKIPITRLGYKASYGEGFKNIRAYLAFQFNMRKYLKRHDYDIVHACDFDTAFFSQGVVRRKNEKFVFDIFDFLYGEPKNFFEKCIKKAQLKIIDKANATIICTEERKMQIRGSNPKNVTVIHNTPSALQLGNATFEIPNNGRTKIVYVGILQDYRLLKEIAEAVSENLDIELHIGGFGKYESFFKDMSERFDNIVYYGRLSYHDTLALENACDIMLAIYDPTIENHRFAAPNKFYESLMLGKPIIMVKNTGMSQVVEKNNIGRLIDYSKEGFVEGIDSLIKVKDDWSQISEKSKKLYHEEYCWDKMEYELLHMYEKLL